MTFLRWAGSKKQLLDALSCCWFAAQCAGGTGRYVEGFSGSAALFFRLDPKRAILVDVNESLQHCLRLVRDSPNELFRKLERFHCSEEEYYRIRALCESSLDPIERAARFIYLNRNCFNGLYRTNLSGVFNVPYGKSRKSGVLPSESELLTASKKLQGADLITEDFYSALIRNVKRGDFVYLDPPYAKANERIRNQYGPNVFGTSDIARLAQIAEEANRRGAYFVISYAKCKEILELTDRWPSYEFLVQRTIAANAGHRVQAAELLISNI